MPVSSPPSEYEFDQLVAEAVLRDADNRVFAVLWRYGQK
jgi:hypothetical protein